LEKKLREQAIQDSLTGLFNRRYLRQSIKNDLARCKRYNSQFSLMMIDINRFKEINDRYSHQTGDKLLQEVAGLLKKTVRNSDTVIRYGGDEFLIVLLETGGNTDQVKKRIRKNIQKWNQKQNLFDFPLTLAIGSSHWEPQTGKDLEEMLKEADLNMYKNKQRFRKKQRKKRGPKFQGID